MDATRNWSLIFDLGDVIFNWSPSVGQSDLSIHLLKEVQSTEIWRQYMCGLVREVECYRHIASRFAITPTEVAEIFDKARQTISLNIDVYNFVKSLKKQYPEIAHIYIMSNVSVVDWRYLQKIRGFSCDIFDEIFVSCEMGVCKPELKSYKHLLQKTRVDPSRAVLIDNKPMNILAARSLGIHGIIFDGLSSLDQSLLNLFSDPVKRGLSFLTSNSKRLHSVTSNGMEIRDNFSQLLIYEATGVLDMLDIEWHEKTWNYFIGSQNLISGHYPDDVDTTCLALVVLPSNPPAAQAVMSQILDLTTSDGIFMTYFDTSRPRTDPAVCVNVLRFFYRYGHGEDEVLLPTKDWIYGTLLHRAYLDGTRYYSSPDVFLFYLSFLLWENPDAEIQRSMQSLLTDRLKERCNTEGNAIELSMRTISCRMLAIEKSSEMDKMKLLNLQERDGGWPISWLCRTGKANVHIGNRGVATALAVHSISDWEKTQKSESGVKHNRWGFTHLFRYLDVQRVTRHRYDLRRRQ